MQVQATERIECRCPICGSSMPAAAMWDDITGAFTAGGRTVYFKRLQRKIMTALWERRGRGGFKDAMAMFEVVFADDPDGGPMNPNSIYVALKKIRTALAVTGWTITRSGRHMAGHRLVKIEANQ